MEFSLFSGTVNVYLNGEKALQFLGTSNDHQNFQINGFVDKEMVIEDHRVGIREAVETYFSTRVPEDFYSMFNRLASLNVIQKEDGKIKIILNDPTEIFSSNYLWIAVGIGPEIPAYDFLMWKIAPISKEEFAIFSIFTDLSSQN